MFNAAVCLKGAIRLIWELVSLNNNAILIIADKRGISSKTFILNSWGCNSSTHKSGLHITYNSLYKLTVLLEYT